MSDEVTQQDDNRNTGNEEGGQFQRRRFNSRRKVCRFCAKKMTLDYLKPEVLERFITDGGKILPRRVTGTCAKHQRELTTTIKRARSLAFIPYLKKHI